MQLRPRTRDDDAPRAELLAGVPSGMGEGRLGPIAFFEAGQVVAYVLRQRRRASLFVFRTLAVDDCLAARVPGVGPRVLLLMRVRTAARIGRARRLFSVLAHVGADPSRLPDSVYVRWGMVLAGRAVAVSALARMAR